MTLPVVARSIKKIATDPKTKAWLEASLDKTFGFPGLVRFSWATVKVILEKEGHPVKW